MVKRDYTGKPVDLAWHSHLSEVNESDDSVVDDTSDRSQGDVETTVGNSSDTELANSIKKYALLNQDATLREIAEEFDCNHSYVYTVLSQESKYYKPTLGDASEKQRRIIRTVARDNGLTQRDAAHAEDVSEAYVSYIVNHNPHLVSQVRGDEP